MPRNPLLDAKRLHIVKVCLDDAEAADLGSLASVSGRSPSQQLGHMGRVAMYGRIGRRPVPVHPSNRAHWGRATLEEIGFTERDFDALMFLARQYRQAGASVLLQLVRTAMHGRVLQRPELDDESMEVVDSLFGDGL